jgi:hypothetical protein
MTFPEVLKKRGVGMVAAPQVYALLPATDRLEFGGTRVRR